MAKEEILCALRHVVAATNKEREDITLSFIEHCVLRSPLESLRARDTMRFFFWYSFEQYSLGRITPENFVVTTYPVFVRFCEGVPRESTTEDIKIIRLINAVLYSRERDPLARTLSPI